MGRLLFVTQPFPVWVVHSPRLARRREECLAALETLGWTARWMERPESSDLGLAFWMRRVRNPRLTRGEVSVYAKHEALLDRIGQEGQPALVLEDDPIFGHDFARRSEPYFAGLPKDWAFVFLGASCGLERPPDPDLGRFARVSATRSMSGYLVTPEAARVVSRSLRDKPIRAPIDLTVNGIIQDLDLRVFWSVPALIENGSESGHFARAITGGRWRGLNPLRFFRS